MRHVSGGVGAARGGGDHRRGGTPRSTTLAAAAATTIVAAVVADATAAVTAVVAGSCRWSWRSCGGRTWSWRSGSLTAPSLRQIRHLAGRSRSHTFHTLCPHPGVPGAGPESVGGVGYAGGAAWAAELREAVDQLADAAGRGAGSCSSCGLDQEEGEGDANACECRVRKLADSAGQRAGSGSCGSLLYQKERWRQSAMIRGKLQSR